MAYDILGKGELDYSPCQYSGSKLLFRGPKRKLNDPYMVALGGTETYGKFTRKPYPDLLEDMLGRKVVNLGCANAGLDVYLNDPALLDICNKAEAIVLQIPGAQNMSNRYYGVHPRRNDRFLQASSLLKMIYADVDFTDYSFTRHLLSALHSASEDKFELVKQELKEAWVGRLKNLLSQFETRVTLLWLSDHSIAEAEDDINASDPLFVDYAMVENVRPFVHELVEIKASADQIKVGQAGLAYSEMDQPAACQMLGTHAHMAAAEGLAEVLGR
ncbi:hypothetical protein SAMN04488030_3224 [Aliiroseovarius halocynthiae]|uniref:DUF6473 domain-containing protein n=1 Tax=Aliiroseovarius halocynthiae TaxID=985055 RepID=A0A545SMZ6_9RHOB|nr:DUF6473 family protein [Aliiroseovarius halocynthiae]TQV66335.1 hypothetical protein FIL88_13295 [Aliiroseovarius halocynthiae]SMR83307.1 hypothetical protein SAMN04488030_3224 [Aliiroseovarius halocynthiae]